MASNNCDDDYVPDGENIEENTTLQIVITVIDQNDVTPEFIEETLFFSLTIGGKIFFFDSYNVHFYLLFKTYISFSCCSLGEDYETFDAKANDTDENPEITYTKTEIEVSDDSTGLEENVPSNGWFNITSGKHIMNICINQMIFSLVL